MRGGGARRLARRGRRAVCGVGPALCAARRLAAGAARLDCKSDSETSPERVIEPQQRANA